MDEYFVLLKRRVIELECYKNLTMRLLHEPIETFPDLLLARDSQLAKMAKTARAVEKYRGTATGGGVTGGGVTGGGVTGGGVTGGRVTDGGVTDGGITDGGGDEFSALDGKIAALKAEIIELDKVAARRVRDEMDNTLEQIKDSEKSNKVAAYMKSANFNVAKGAALNTRS
jgi:hypothetical protein